MGMNGGDAVRGCGTEVLFKSSVPRQLDLLIGASSTVFGLSC